MSKRVAETAVTNFAIQGLAAITGIIVARLLGVDGRGDLAAVMVWPTILAGMAVMGTDVGFARVAASEPERLRGIFRAMTAAVIILSIPTAVVGFYLMPVLLHSKHDLLPTARLLLVVIPASVASVLCANVALGLGKHHLFNSIRLSYSAAFLGFVLVAAAFIRPTVLSVAVSFMIAAYVTAAYGWIATRGEMATGSGPKLGVREITASAAPFGLVTITQAIITNLPVAFLAATVASTHVGYFVVATVAAGIHASLGSAIGKIVFAKVSTGKPDASQWLAPVFRQSLILYFFLALALACILPFLVPLLFGHEFAYSGRLSIGLVISTSIIALASVLEEFLRGKGHARQILIAQVLGAVFLFSLAVVLIPRLGLVGMIWASIVGAVAQFVATATAVSLVSGISPRELLVANAGDLRALLARVGSMRA